MATMFAAAKHLRNPPRLGNRKSQRPENSKK
jgi:hypothetical protein